MMIMSLTGYYAHNIIMHDHHANEWLLQTQHVDHVTDGLLYTHRDDHVMDCNWLQNKLMHFHVSDLI